MNEEEYYPGKGCQCYAHSESECACNVDWTEPEVYELRDEVKELKKWKETVIEELMSIGIYTEEWASDPEKALHHIICWHTETGIHLAESERRHKSLLFKLECLWYKTPFPYWFIKMKYKNKQPPF